MDGRGEEQGGAKAPARDDGAARPPPALLSRSRVAAGDGRAGGCRAAREATLFYHLVPPLGSAHLPAHLLPYPPSTPHKRDGWGAKKLGPLTRGGGRGETGGGPRQDPATTRVSNTAQQTLGQWPVGVPPTTPVSHPAGRARGTHGSQWVGRWAPATAAAAPRKPSLTTGARPPGLAPAQEDRTPAFRLPPLTPPPPPGKKAGAQEKSIQKPRQAPSRGTRSMGPRWRVCSCKCGRKEATPPRSGHRTAVRRDTGHGRREGGARGVEKQRTAGATPRKQRSMRGGQRRGGEGGECGSSGCYPLHTPPLADQGARAAAAVEADDHVRRWETATKIESPRAGVRRRRQAPRAARRWGGRSRESDSEPRGGTRAAATDATAEEGGKGEGRGGGGEDGVAIHTTAASSGPPTSGGTPQRGT